MSTDEQIEKIVLNNPSFKLPLSVMKLKFQEQNLKHKKEFEGILNQCNQVSLAREEDREHSES